MQNLKKIPNIEYRGFQRKIACYGILCESHIDERLLGENNDDNNDFSETEYDYDKFKFRQRMRYKIGYKIESFMTFEVFKKNFHKRSFQSISSIFIRFLFTCRCEKLYDYLKELSDLLNEKEDLRYSTKVVILVFVRDGPFEIGKIEFLNDLEQKRVEKLLKVNNSIVIIHELPSFKVKNIGSLHLWYSKLRTRMLRCGLQEVLPRVTYGPYTVNTIWLTNTRGELYADAINPALGIILNHLTFPEEKQYRTGSLKDVETLSNLFVQKNMPHIVIQDGRIEHDNAVFNMLKNETLNDVKNIYTFIMSHGKENDIIKSGGDEYPVYERLKEIMKNSSLKDVNKIFFIIACRGKINPEWDYIKITEDEKTDASALDEKTVVIHSVPKHHISPRTEDGAVFVQHVRKILSEPFDELPVDDLAAKIDENLEVCNYYCEYEDNQRFDYVKKDQTAINLSTTSTSFSDVSCFSKKDHKPKVKPKLSEIEKQLFEIGRKIEDKQNEISKKLYQKLSAKDVKNNKEMK